MSSATTPTALNNFSLALSGDLGWEAIFGRESQDAVFCRGLAIETALEASNANMRNASSFTNHPLRNAKSEFGLKDFADQPHVATGVEDGALQHSANWFRAFRLVVVFNYTFTIFRACGDGLLMHGHGIVDE